MIGGKKKATGGDHVHPASHHATKLSLPTATPEEKLCADVWLFIDSKMRLALQVQRLGLPALVLLNMADEASRFGGQINTEALSTGLKLPVQLLSAKYRQGIDTLQHRLVHQLEAQQEPVAAVQ